MASIETRRRRDGTKIYRVRFRHDGQHRSVQFDACDKDEAHEFKSYVDANPARALAALARANPQLQQQSHPEPDPTATVLARALQYAKSRTTKAAPEHRRKIARDFELHLGDLALMRLDEVTRADIQEWCDALTEDGLASGTIEKLRAQLSPVFRFAALEGLITVNPATGAHAHETLDDARRPVFLEHYEYDAILASLSGEHRVYVELLAGTGLRRGEAVVLLVGDVHLDTDHPAISVTKAIKYGGPDGPSRIGTTKTRAGKRTVVIDDDLADLLRRHTAGRAAHEPLWPEHGIDATWQGRHWVPAIKAAMLPEGRRPRIHDLRHTHASWLLAARIPLFEVSKRLGHATMKTTADIYGHMDTHSMSSAEIGAAMRGRRPALHVVV